MTQRFSRLEQEKLLRKFYLVHNPQRIGNVPAILDSFDGEEKALEDACKEKYGSSPFDVAPRDISSSGETPSSFKLQLDSLSLIEQQIQSLSKGDFSDLTCQQQVRVFADLAHDFVHDCTVFVSLINSSQNRGIFDQRASQPSGIYPRQAEARPENPTKGLLPKLIDVMQLPGVTSCHGLIAAALERASPGDTIVVHPGVYFENLIIRAPVELRAALENKPPVLQPVNPDIPIIQVLNSGTVCLSGSTLQELSSNSARSLAPLCVVSGPNAALCAKRVKFIGGSTGVVVHHSEVTLSGCEIANASFAGVYAKENSKAVLLDSIFNKCEVAVRASNAVLEVTHSKILSCNSDGITFHRSVSATLNNVEISDCNDNGVLLSPTSTASFLQCLFSGNRHFGIFVPVGSLFKLDDCTFFGNGTAPHN